MRWRHSGLGRRDRASLSPERGQGRKKALKAWALGWGALAGKTKGRESKKEKAV